jgi:hypothetical protein
MEIERSLLFPQETAIGPYPETKKKIKSTPSNPMSLCIHFNIILTSTPRSFELSLSF